MLHYNPASLPLSTVALLPPLRSSEELVDGIPVVRIPGSPNIRETIRVSSRVETTARGALAIYRHRTDASRPAIWKETAPNEGIALVLSGDGDPEYRDAVHFAELSEDRLDPRGEALLRRFVTLRRAPSRIALVSCGKSKRTESSKIRDLYTGSLFRASLREAERTADRVYVVSALYGLVGLDEVRAPYDRKLSDLSRVEVKAWAERISEELEASYPYGLDVDLYGGSSYTYPLIAALPRRFRTVDVLEGLTLGLRLSYLAKRRNLPATGWAAEVKS